MKPTAMRIHFLLVWVLGAALLGTGPALRADVKIGDPIGENLFPPELLKQARPVLELTQPQESDLITMVHKVEGRMAELKEKLARETEKLAELVKQERLNEEEVLAQSDKLLELEHRMKRLQLTLLVRIKNILTPKQQAELRGVKAVLEAIKAKVLKVKTEAAQWEKDGRDLAPLADLKERLDPLLQAGRFKEVGELLDAALKKFAQPGSK